MEELAKIQILQKEKERLEGENRRWEETQTDKLDAKSEKALDFYRNERASTLKNRADEIADITKKIEALEKKKESLEKSIPEYIKYSDSMISRFSSPTIIKPERIRRNDDRLNRIRLDIEMIELHQKNLQTVESPTHIFQYGVLPEKTWEPTPSEKLTAMEEEIRIARAARVREPEN